MDTDTTSHPAPAPLAALAAAVGNSDPFQASSLPPTNRSNSTSPYADDESFAMFVAQEANEAVSVLDPENSSLSPSPTPTPTPLSHVLLPPSVSYDAFLNSSGSSSSSFGAVVQQFGVTASCPPTPLQLNEDAPCAVSLDSSANII